MSNESDEKMFGALILGFLGGVIIFLLLLIILLPSISISQETADDICSQLTGNETAVASVEHEKLICELPSFDSTQNIIIRFNSEGNN